MSAAQPQPQPNVLFVDDEPDFLRLITETFHDMSGGRWRIHRAGSVDQALDMLKHQRMDLVVVDINMPLLDGVQLLRMLGRRHPDVKKVTLTGFATEAKRNECLAAGSELFIEKPRTQQGYKSVFAMLDELATWTPQQGFQGMLRQVGLNDVIQMECLGRNSSILEISNQHQQGRIYIEDGAIIHAVCGEEDGEPAFYKLLCIAGGQFKLHPFEAPPRKSIEGSWEFLLMEAARVRDEQAAQPAAQAGETAGTAEAEAIPDLQLPAAEPDVVVAETLVCAPDGKTLYTWQCADPLARFTLLQSVSQQAGLLAASLPLGALERLEIQQTGCRSVASFKPAYSTFVRVANLVPAE